MIEKGDLAPAEQLLRRFLAQGAARSVTISWARCSRPRDARTKRSASSSRPSGNPSLLDARQHLARLYLGQKREADAARPSSAARPPSGPSSAIWRSSWRHRARGRATRRRRSGSSGRSPIGSSPSGPAAARPAAVGAEERGRGLGCRCARRARWRPNSEDVLSAYAEALLASPTPDAAIPVLGALTRMYPTVARYQYLQGVALLGAGDAAAAVPFLQEAVRLEPDQAPTLIALGTGAQPASSSTPRPSRTCSAP